MVNNVRPLVPVNPSENSDNGKDTPSRFSRTMVGKIIVHYPVETTKVLKIPREKTR